VPRDGRSSWGTKLEVRHLHPVLIASSKTHRIPLPPLPYLSIHPDLDSLSSSIAYAYLTRLLSPSSSSTTINPQKTLPLILSPLSSLALRPENILALQSALLLPKSTTASSLTSSSPPYTSFPLLCTDELPIPTDQLAAKGVSFALVDHNRLLTQFVPKVTAEEEEGDPSKGPVVAILDHHEDEGLYISSSPPCDPRIVDRNAGSASSLVTNHFASFLSSSGIPPPTSPHFPIPKELATLLISSVLIDTGGLKPNGKAHPLDHQAISFLYPISTFAHPTPSSPSSISPDEEQALTASYTQGDAIPSPLTELASTLLTVKKDVSHLPTASLLARDYKQYTFLSPLSPSSSSTSNDNGNAPRPIHLGLATVPLGLSDWLARPTQNGEEAWSAFRKELETFCSTHGLEVLGVLTTYRSSKDKHRREILLYMPSRSSSSSSSSAASPSVYNALLSGLSSHPDLSCQDWKDGSNVLPEGGAEVVWGKGAKGKIWRQGNADATRKVVAPAFKAILEGGEEEKEVGRGRGGAFR
jgi:exopolyphosphatase